MILPHRGQLVFALLLVLPFTAIAEEPGTENDPDPNQRLSTNLQERVEKRLIQLDVTVTGPADVIPTLTSEDFVLYIGNIALGGQRVEDLHIDRMCSTSEGADAEHAEHAVLGPKASYVFYFDQAHLSMEGRVRSLELARGLIDELISPTSPAMIVSSAAETRTFADLTDDRSVLFHALDRIEHDPKQWDTFAELEYSRAAKTFDALKFGGWFTKFVVESTQEAEVDHTTTAVRRLAMVLRRLSDLPPPKVLLYFGDTLKSKPGQFYLRPQDFTDIGPGDRYAAAKIFDAMLNDAAAAEVRIYGVQAGYPHGLGSETLSAARHTLMALGKQTGGGYFLYGTPVDKMARKLRKDLACFYVLSFDPTGLPEDRRLGVQLEVTQPKVKLHTRRQIIVRSAAARKETELMAAFASPEVSSSGLSLVGSAIPISYMNGKYSTLVQIAVPPSLLDEAHWNFGVSPASGKKKNVAQGSVSMNRAGIPVVFEAEISLSPGSHDLVLVAQDTVSRKIGTKMLRTAWPDPGSAPITVGPVAVLQPRDALFMRGEGTRKSGFLIHGPEQLIRTDLSTVLVTLVCADGSTDQGVVSVERAIAGSDAASFPDIEIDLRESDGCTHVRDMIPAGVMTAGVFGYEIRVLDGTRELVKSERVFQAMSPLIGAPEGPEK